ncbi:hypothetical protein LEP1GSC161_0746 [Leptospira santarosai str. CBC1416]|uniref:Uncharacterized protein n=1 Tax=Leptospira santarosai str. CBC1416 TaxID=1193059 RepID=M6VP09_9LEPT|nr:hypothetical protein LEP1GSC161_0746 [Leptospira santarosai str. CBC1416]
MFCVFIRTFLFVGMLASNPRLSSPEGGAILSKTKRRFRTET